MQKITIPYGKSFMTGTVNESELLGIFHSNLPAAVPDERAETLRALANPIGSARLEELASKAETAVIIASDHTRPVPSKILMPCLLEALRRGNPAIDITILIATGFHRQTTREELVRKFGEEIVAKEKIRVHDSGDASQLTEIGTLPSGGKLIVNKMAVETDLLISEGFIEPHFFAGFSGGRKSILPGIASRTTVLANHCAEFIMSPNARTGKLDGNPIHADMLYAAKKAKLAFILNVVIDSRKKIIRAFAGDPVAAHRAGTDFLGSIARIQVPEADIAVTGNGGYPLDQNVYQSVKGMTAGEAVVRKNGIIILCAACNDGHGGQSFYDHLSSCSAAEILQKVKNIPRDQTEPDQWEYQILARILATYTVILVTEDCDHAMLERMGLKTAFTLDEALDMARRLCGSNPKIAVIPDGVSVIAEKIS